MPTVEIDGTNSTVKTNVLTSQSASAITVPTGKVLTVTDAAGLTVNGVVPLSGANDSVDSQHYTDGSIDEAHIAADAVNFATHLKAGTAGELITWDASGDPAAVPVGTATHVLTSGGAGVAPTFAAAAAGGTSKNYIIDGDFTEWSGSGSNGLIGSLNNVSNITGNNAYYAALWQSNGSSGFTMNRSTDVPTFTQASHLSKYSLKCIVNSTRTQSGNEIESDGVS